MQSKAYILPYGVNAIQVTTTEKGITSRDIISKRVKLPLGHRLIFAFSGHIQWNAHRDSLDTVRSTSAVGPDAHGSVGNGCECFFLFRYDARLICREEGLIMYTPEIMVNFESVINYYKYSHNIRGIHTAASGLESTSIVFAYGLGRRRAAVLGKMP